MADGPGVVKLCPDAAGNHFWNASSATFLRDEKWRKLGP
jgi:hypothetical protein